MASVPSNFAASASRTESKRVVVGSPLTLADVCTRISRRLKWYGLAHLQLEQVAEADGGMLAAVVRDRRDQSIIRRVVDRETGTVMPSFDRVLGRRR